MSIAARKHQKASGGSVPELYLSPSSTTVSNGNTVVITVYENSYAQAVNAIQANFTYPTNRLTFQSISTSNSNFTTTIQSDGGSGSVQIGVGLLGNSLTGNQEVARVTFTASGVGSASLSFTAGSGIARASDSTDICQKQTGSTVTVQ